MSDPPDPDQGERKETAKIKILARVTLRKFDGDDTSGEPIETIVLKDDGFDEAVLKGSDHATD